jgi:tripartite ATP-independent transporter DctP family solute receptor
VENTVKEWQIFDLPYLFDSVDQANRILQGPVGNTFMNMLPQHDLVGLAWFSCLERNVFTANKPVRTLNDLKGLKIRVLQSPGYVSAFRALGANPTPLAYSELYLAVQQGVVDGGDTPPDQFVKDKFLEVAKNYSLTRINDQAIVFLMSKAVMDKLPKDAQDAILAAAKQAAQYDIKLYKDDTDKALQEIERKGVHIIHVDTKPWIEATNAIRADLISKIPSGDSLYRDIVAAKAAASN